MSVLLSIFGFVLAIGLLVAVHEYGHFQVARWCGVKVLRFSVGFGKPIWEKTAKDGVTYQLAAIPLGGYVKMLDEREAPVDDAEKHLAFNTQNVWKRIAIVSAGPAANFAFAILAWWLVFMLGVDATRPELGPIAPSTAAAEAGLQAGDLVTELDGSAVLSWESLRLSLIEKSLTSDEVSMTVDRSGEAHTVILPLTGAPEEVDQNAGLNVWRPVLSSAIGMLVDGGAAKEAGLMAGDLVTAVDGESVATWTGLVEIVQASPNKLITLTVDREGQVLHIPIIPERRELKSGGESRAIGFAGVGPLIDESVKSAIRERQLLLQ